MTASDYAAWLGVVIATTALIWQIVDSRRSRPRISVLLSPAGWSLTFTITASDTTVLTGMRLVGYKNLLSRILGRCVVIDDPRIKNIEYPCQLQPHVPINATIRFARFPEPDSKFSRDFKICELQIFDAFHPKPKTVRLQLSGEEHKVI